MPSVHHTRHRYHSEKSAEQQLLANDFAYRLLLDNLVKLGKRAAPDVLRRAEEIANYAWLAHPGRFTDGVVENILLRAGQDLEPWTASAIARRTAAGATRTLHVASELYLTGGHSRALAKWVQRDLHSSHAIVVTRQVGPVPDFLSAIAEDRRAPITRLDPNDDIRQRARALRSLSQDCDRVILHHHPDDAVPVLAYAVPGGCPVAMFNHAHFAYSLGSSVADIIINTMPYFRELTRRYRYPQATALLEGPLGLDRLHWSDIDKRVAKQRLGLPPACPVAMTIGAESYFTPSGDSDFFATLGLLLARRTDLHVLVVGVGDKSALVPSRIRDTGRVRLVGPVADPRPYFEAADICLESFPTPSLGALTESVAYGEAFPVPAFAESENPLRVNQQRVSSIAVRQRTEADYVSYVLQLLDSPEVTRARAATLRRVLVHDDECFGDQFEALNALIDRAVHAPRQLPATECAVTHEHIALASTTHPRRLRATIWRLPASGRVAAYARAVASGHESIGEAASDVPRHLARAVIRRLGLGRKG
jgi:hypothetical protein